MTITYLFYMRRQFFLIPFLFFMHSISAQDAKNTNTMLWRISGKGLTKPSYLFGTIHLTDKRVFQLGDSLYKALEETDAFAAELDMNSLGTQMINYFLRQEEEKNATEPAKLKDVLNTETWNRYKDILAQKIGKKAEKITVNDLEEIETRFQTDIFKKGDMPTFLDAWLFGQARKSGKWVGGIEDFQDQVEHIESIEGKIQLALFDDDYYRAGLEWMIKIYMAQQLDSIDALMYREASGRKDYIMTKRNQKMALRIDSLSAIRSTLFAIGAGHLPGDSGVISLLRSRGFTVTPVLSSKKISADKYVAKATISSWYPVNIADSVYVLEMPGYAEKLEMLETMGFDIKMFFDIAFMRMYMTMSLQLPEERKKLGVDSLYRSLGKFYTSKGMVSRESVVKINGQEGREYFISIDGGEMRMQIFVPGFERVVLNALFAFKKEAIKDSESEQFFQSFVYKGGNISKPNAEKKWVTYDYSRLSFSVDMPLKPKETKDVVSDEGKAVYKMQAYDIGDQVYYGISVEAMKKGMYASGNDLEGFLQMKENLKQEYTNTEILDSAFITLDGYSGYRLTLKGDTEGETLITKILSVPRGGINYYLFAVYHPSSKNSDNADRFINSFRLIPYSHPEWKKITSPDKKFSVICPYELSLYDADEEKEGIFAERYILFDSVACVTSYIERVDLPNWLWYSSDTAFLRSNSESHYSVGDSLVDYKTEEKEGLTITSFTLMKQGDDLVKKVKLVLNGNELYEIYGFFNKQDLAGIYKLFFDEFTVLQLQKKRTMPANASNDLSKFLSRATLKDIILVKQYWDLLEFKQVDIQALREMMLKQYPDFDTTYSNNLNKKIFDELTYIDTNFTSTVFLGEQYGKILPENEYVKPLIISYLSKAFTDSAYKILKNCLVNYPMRMRDNLPYFYHSLYDSLELTATLFPELMKEAGSKPIWDLVCGITTSLLDSGLLARNAVKDYASYFVSTAKRILEEEVKQIEESPYGLLELIKILGVIATSETGKLLTQFSKINNDEIKFRTMIAMLESNMPVNDISILAMAVRDEFRHDLYDELKRLNKVNRIPANFRSQKELGRSKLYEYITDDEYELNQLSYLGEKIISYKGSQQKFHLYKVIFTGEEEPLLGVAGPYSLKSTELSSNHDATGAFWEGTFNPKKLDQLLKEYLESLENY